MVPEEVSWISYQWFGKLTNLVRQAYLTCTRWIWARFVMLRTMYMPLA